MFMWLLARRVQRIRERREWPCGWGALWLVIVLQLALFEFRVLCFWGPVCVEAYEGFGRRRRRLGLRRGKADHGRDGWEIDSER